MRDKILRKIRPQDVIIFYFGNCGQSCFDFSTFTSGYSSTSAGGVCHWGQRFMEKRKKRPLWNYPEWS